MSAASSKAANTEAGRLSPQFLDRLAKILGLLGSHHDGEVLAAGRRAHMMITGAGWTWPALLGAPSAVQDCRQARQVVEACLATVNSFELYEQKFLAQILPQLKRGRRLSEKQLAWLCRLHERALSRGGAA